MPKLSVSAGVKTRTDSEPAILSLQEGLLKSQTLASTTGLLNSTRAADTKNRGSSSLVKLRNLISCENHALHSVLGDHS